MLTDRPILTLAELEAHDPLSPADRRERRFLCPLPACGDHQRRSEHRSLSLNVDSGVWVCHRCQAGGKLHERWVSKRDLASIHLRRAFNVYQQPPATRAEPAPPQQPAVWREAWLDAEPILWTPGARYLAERGISNELATDAGVRYLDDFYGRPAALFPVRDRARGLVAVIGRYIDGGTTPKGRAAGPKSHGVFAAPGALQAERLVITEAPIDALSLAAAGVPAIALGGTSGPDWLPSAAALRLVALALDSDEAGDAAASRLATTLLPFGARVERWRPMAKDWNDALLTHGADALRDHFANR